MFKIVFSIYFHKENKINKRYDWNEIRRIYVEGFSSNGQIVFLNLNELSDMCKVKYNYLRQYAANEKWLQQREIYRKKIEFSKKHEISKLLAGEGAEFDSKTLELARAGILQIKAYFLAHKKLMKEAKKEKMRIPLLNYKVLDSLSRALVAFQKIGKLALNEELPPEKTYHKVVFEFLKEEKILTDKEREQFLRIAIKTEREFSKINGNSK